MKRGWWWAGALAVCGWGAESPEAARWWAHVAYLADDKLEGRDTGSPGHKQAARYVMQEFERAGLRPKGVNAYSQPVQFESLRLNEEKSRLALVGADGEVELKLGEDAYFSLRGNPRPEVEADAVFAGYGFAVPEKGYDELSGLDVKDKIVVYVSGAPKGLPAALVSHNQSTQVRWKRLKDAGAVGIATISNPRNTDIPWARARMARLLPTMRLVEIAADGAGCSITVNPTKTDAWLAGTGHNIDDIFAKAAKGEALPKFALRVRVKARMAIERMAVESENVIGLREGSHGRLKNEYVVLSAHLDHVGVGKTLVGDQIYNGAMDNASGIATMIEIARGLKGKKLKRGVLFVAVTGEEKGLLGSQYFVHAPTVGRETIVGNINFDMFLPLFALKRVVVYGLEESTLGDVSRAVASKMGIEAMADPEPQRNSFIRSDQYSFIRRGIPAVSFKVGYAPGSAEERTFKAWLRERYHAVSDDLSQPVDKEAAAQFNKLMTNIVVDVANREERPRWKESSFFKTYAQ